MKQAPHKKTTPAAVQIMEQIKIKKGSSEPNRVKVGAITWDQIRTIAEDKLPDLNCFTIDLHCCWWSL